MEIRLDTRMTLEEDPLDLLLIIQSLLEHEKRLKALEKKVNLLTKEISMLEVIFEEQKKRGVVLNLGTEVRTEEVTYLQKLWKVLESISKEVELEESQ
ncbi:hypothetical protein CW700_01930 [Candidatus Bathyarchaeota archaeon]|nr:MAG: hypothetical protein CW700_01930 [Candidatus Bathyarchaeota archaeon]